MSGAQQQWIRQGSLIVAASPAVGASTAAQPGLDLSELHYSFNIRQQDAETPNTAHIRVYNLKRETLIRIQKEFTRVILQAGYKNASVGVIFDGTIKQTRSGREKNTDTFLDILAAEGDLPYNFATINTTLAPGATQQQQLDAVGQAVAPYGAEIDSSALAQTGGVLPRGKVLFGMALSAMASMAQTSGWTWSIQGGNVKVIPLTGYLPGEAVVLTSKTGLIGQPESTQEGIKALILINPKVRVGTRVQIANYLINQTSNTDGNIVPSYDNPFAGAFAAVTDDGFYRVIVQEYEGDSRGAPWYAKLTCLAIDSSAPPATAVPAYP